MGSGHHSCALSSASGGGLYLFLCVPSGFDNARRTSACVCQYWVRRLYFQLLCFERCVHVGHIRLLTFLCFGRCACSRRRSQVSCVRRGVCTLNFISIFPSLFFVLPSPLIPQNIHHHKHIRKRTKNGLHRTAQEQEEERTRVRRSRTCRQAQEASLRTRKRRRTAPPQDLV